MLSSHLSTSVAAEDFTHTHARTHTRTHARTHAHTHTHTHVLTTDEYVCEETWHDI